MSLHLYPHDDETAVIVTERPSAIRSEVDTLLRSDCATMVTMHAPGHGRYIFLPVADYVKRPREGQYWAIVFEGDYGNLSARLYGAANRAAAEFRELEREVARILRPDLP